MGLSVGSVAGKQAGQVRVQKSAFRVQALPYFAERLPFKIQRREVGRGERVQLAPVWPAAISLEYRLHRGEERPIVFLEKPVYGNGYRVLPIEWTEPGIVRLYIANLKGKEHLWKALFNEFHDFPEGLLPVFPGQVVLHFIEAHITVTGVVLPRWRHFLFPGQGAHVSPENQSPQPG